jgi:hypothetical protein
LAITEKMPLEPERFAFPGLNVHVRELNLYLDDFADVQLRTLEKFSDKFPKFLSCFTRLRRLTTEISSVGHINESFRSGTRLRLFGLNEKMRRHGVVVGGELIRKNAEYTSFDLAGFGDKFQVI